jgi:hypothetical protein
MLLWELKKLSLWEMWSDGFERILWIRVCVIGIWVRFCGGGVVCEVLERVLVIDATVSNSDTCFHVEFDDDVFIGFVIVCCDYDVLKLLFVIIMGLKMALSSSPSSFSFLV